MVISQDDMELHRTPIFLRYGGTEKLTTEMTKGELAQVSASILKRTKEKAFSKRRPVIFGEGGKVLAEWPDGRIEELKTEG
ncbi:hypothetical protein A4D02_23380 [Niastella koreensis]|uniref:Uncharacterized protein n=3 Tax=Niastella koreensis TaxID=354356 RepID=G8TAT1_NIAKG|nr:hypothetical protein Niako_3992 [Niastella koreensis GR20-10]OQP52146.1 hypothetical protein A4D02_23380 [Niastella koreensis]